MLCALYLPTLLFEVKIPCQPSLEWSVCTIPLQVLVRFPYRTYGFRGLRAVRVAFNFSIQNQNPTNQSTFILLFSSLRHSLVFPFIPYSFSSSINLPLTEIIPATNYQFFFSFSPPDRIRNRIQIPRLTSRRRHHLLLLVSSSF